jgi:hypothetical protein
MSYFDYVTGNHERKITDLEVEVERLQRLVAYWHKQHDCEFELRHAETERLQEALAKERERCAQVMDDLASRHRLPEIITCYRHAAVVIRALKDEP